MTCKQLFGIATILVASFLPLVAQAESPRQAGIGVVWGRHDDEAILNYPYVRFGQGAFIWKNIEPHENEYDWSAVDATLKRFHDLGKKVPIQINTPCPEWVFNYVACVGTSRGGKAPQYWDPVYFEILSKFIKAYATHLSASPYKDSVLFVRMQFNALNTEILSFKSGYLKGTATPDRMKWTLPPNGHKFAPDLTPAIETEMIQKITELYLTEFFPHNIPVALRMDGENDLTKPGSTVDGQAIYDRWTSNPLAWSMTTHYGIGLIASPESFRFKRRCRERNTTGFAEQFARISPGQGQFAADEIAKKMRTVYLPDANAGAWKLYELSPEQSFYWTMLMMLDWGVSYVAVYGADHVWAHHNADCVAAMEFVNKYAGWARDPQNSPGAWTALGLFRQRPLPNGRDAGGENVNWGFFITQENPETATDPVYLEGGKSTVQGVWARRIKAAASFTLDPVFAGSMEGKSFARISWLQETGAALRLCVSGKVIATVASDNSGQWKDTWVELPANVFGKSGNKTFVLEPAAGKPAVHLLEICRKRNESTK